MCIMNGHSSIMVMYVSHGLLHPKRSQLQAPLLQENGQHHRLLVLCEQQKLWVLLHRPPRLW